MHPTTFEYLEPTATQKETMAHMRRVFGDCALEIDTHIPEGPDKTYLLRKLRECAMWANVAITRNADGTPRGGAA